MKKPGAPKALNFRKKMQIKIMRLRGYTLNEIAAKLDISVATIQNYRKKRGYYSGRN